MKVSISKSKNKTIFYISKSIWINGKSTTKTVEKLGSLEEVREKAGGMDPYEWAKQYAAELTKREKEKNRENHGYANCSGRGIYPRIHLF